MSLDDVHREQQARPCACPCLSSRDCIRSRYPHSYVEDDDGYGFHDPDERCECSCHDGEGGS